MLIQPCRISSGISVLEQAVHGVASKVRIKGDFLHVEAGAQIPDASLDRAKIDHVPRCRRDQFIGRPGGIRHAVAIGPRGCKLSFGQKNLGHTK
jgi:hypothetical protein